MEWREARSPVVEIRLGWHLGVIPWRQVVVVVV
jgi:hypothetical protein